MRRTSLLVVAAATAASVLTMVAAFAPPLLLASSRCGYVAYGHVWWVSSIKTNQIERPRASIDRFPM
jgi:hypothetical protein